MSTIRKRLVRRPTTPNAQLTRLHTETADIVNALLDGGSDVAFENGVGVVLQSPDGHYWRLSVDNTGTLATTDLGTDRP